MYGWGLAQLGARAFPLDQSLWERDGLWGLTKGGTMIGSFTVGWGRDLSLMEIGVLQIVCAHRKGR